LDGIKCNKLELNKARPEQILVGRPEVSFENGEPIWGNMEASSDGVNQLGKQLAVQFEELQHVVFARMVQKVGDRLYWEQWAKDVAQIAERQVARITKLIREDAKHHQEFDIFLSSLRKNINPGISAQEAIEMLSQHIITKPVFEALFEGYSFVNNNPISISMQTILDLLETGSLEKDSETLQKFYDSVRKKASGIDNAEGKQRIIVELYDKFFKTAFPKMVEKLGIVYTPVEVVDFIIHSVNDVLKKEFGRSLSDENIHILDPFTGTGTFVTRLIQSGLISHDDLRRKYQHEIHANEIVLLAYYIAAVNIENAYHDIIGNSEYLAFDGICLTDTFQLGETAVTQYKTNDVFSSNQDRVIRQRDAPLKVIMGNPPYSIGQKSANDNAQNQKYEKLDLRIANTYAKESSAGLNKSLYDAYIKAFRWSADRLDPKTGGIICFVSNGAWLDGNSTDGFRKTLEKEFSSIYVFDLRGNQRTSGELSRKEGGKIFGSGSRTPIAITLLVKNPSQLNTKALINYHDIGDYLNREEKLMILKKTASVVNIAWKLINPNKEGDWISHRNNLYDGFIPLMPEKKFDLKSESFFVAQTPGVLSNREAWVYNFSSNIVKANIAGMIDFYNQQRLLFLKAKAENQNLIVEDFVDPSPQKISWTRGLRNNLNRNIDQTFDPSKVCVATLRPFMKQYFYNDNKLIESPGLFKVLFPSSQFENRLISVSGVGASKENGVFITNQIIDYNAIDAGAKCFPLYYYEERQLENLGLFDVVGESKYIRRDGISDFILKRAHKMYGKTINKEDIFYYVYGFLHSPQYRGQFVNDLKKMLPRLILVDDVRVFYKFSKAGRELAELHINYENVSHNSDIKVTGQEEEFFLVEKMRFPKKDERDTIIYNSHVRISNIPQEAYDYQVNGKSAVEWVMERYQLSTHKETGIKNNPNDWANEAKNPRYILDLLLSVISMSIKAVNIIKDLPELAFDLIENSIDSDNNINNLGGLLNIDENLAPAAMKEFSLNEGIYFINDVVQITRISVDKVTRWFKELSNENYEGLSNSQQDDVKKMRISFYGLIELVVIGTLRDNKFPLKKILTARANLKSVTKKIYPFATNNVRDDLKAAGNSIVFTIGDNVITLDGTSQLNLNIIKSFFNNIEFDTEGLAQQLFPVKDSKLIVVDPKQGGGKAVINNGGAVWAETIASIYDGPGSIEMLTSQYDITKEQILAAVEYLN
jgi:predicted helicase/uncharacterized protein (DUF433 family)